MLANDHLLDSKMTYSFAKLEFGGIHRKWPENPMAQEGSYGPK